MHILVPLKNYGKAGQLIPYIEEIAQPGMKVVFLLPYQSPAFAWLKGRLLVMHTGIRPELLPGKRREGYSVKEQRQLAQNELIPACEGLRRRGVEVAVDVYLGHLSRVVEVYTHNEDIHLIMMVTGADHLILRLIYRFRALLHRFKRPPLPPVLLLQPYHRS